MRVSVEIWKLRSDSSGNVLPLAAMGVLVMAALVGGGVDMSRAYKAENRLQAACDAGVLAGRKKVGTDGFDTTAEDEANAYFAANFNQAQHEAESTVFEATSIDNGNTVSGTASTSVKAIVMPIFGFDTIDISLNCSSSMGLGNSDITFVLDVTGSMADTAAGRTPGRGETSRLDDLQAAMKNFYATVDDAAAGSNTRVRYAFVPYSTTVNVGEIVTNRDEAYIVDSFAYQSRRWVKWGSPTAGDPIDGHSANEDSDSNWTRTGSGYANQTACAANLPATNPSGWSNDGSSSPGSSSYIDDSGNKVTATLTMQPQKRTNYSCRKRSSNNLWYVNTYYDYRDWVSGTTSYRTPTVATSTSDPYDELVYGQYQLDTSSFKGFNSVSLLIGSSSSRPSMVSSTWEGCIEERETVPESSFTFVEGTGITPAGAIDLDIDTPPDAADNSTKWAPLWGKVGYYRSAGTMFSLSGSSASYSCPYQAQLLAEMDQDSFDAYADSLDTGGNTYHDIGLLWGARFSSPEGIWQDNVNEDPSNGGAVSRHLIFMTDGELAPTTTVHSAYGIERNDLRVTTGGSSSDQYDNHRSRFLAICEAVKAKGIRLWVVAFGTGLTDDLKTCASANSSYAASSASELNESFQEIAKQVGELRAVM